MSWTKSLPLKWLYAYRWRVGIRPRTYGPLLTSRLENFTFLDAPPGHFYADPFIMEQDNRVFLFFEDYSFLNRSADLSCAELDGSCNVRHRQTIVHRPYHLSYPHVFQFDGSYYMIPETASANRVELYRAAEFPWKWEFVKVLLSGAKFYDATCVSFEGKYWILAGGSSTAASGKYDELHVFHAPTIFDRFRPHRSNPVKTDLASARPAGAIIRDGECLIRPVQNCSRWYGDDLIFMRIDVLSEAAYSERHFASLPNWKPCARDLGIHTYNASERFEVIDVCSYGIEPAAMVGRANSLTKLRVGRCQKPLSEVATQCQR